MHDGTPRGRTVDTVRPVSAHDPSDRFGPGVQAWAKTVGSTRDVVRQRLVTAQLGDHLGPAPLRILDAGCGQGTQVLALAEAGHQVVGIDRSSELLAVAERALGGAPPEVCRRVTLRLGDVTALDDDLMGRFDAVCCHGVVMYLPSLDDAVAHLARALRPGGLFSLLTRNRFAIAMRAGMAADWAGAVDGFDARHYRNRLGIEQVRADEPAEVRAAMEAAGLGVQAWYGVRLFTDARPTEPPPADIDAMAAAELESGRRDPYRSVAALTHTLARTPADGPEWS